MRKLLTVLPVLLVLAGIAPAARADDPGPAPVPVEQPAQQPDQKPASDPLDTAESSAPARAFVAPGSPGNVQCMGPKFQQTSRDAADAQALMDGYLTLPSFGRWRLPQNPTWSEDPFKNSNWVFQLQTLRWADVLRREGLRTGDSAMVDRYLYLVRDWVANNPYLKGRSSFAWYDMAVGVRAITLVCASDLVDAPWLTAARSDHARSLSDPRQYRTTGNHALHQNMGLLALGCTTGTQSWIDLALSRSRTLLSRSVDAQGGSDEGSMLYQALNYNWYRELQSRIELCGVTPDPLFSRVGLMPDFYAHAIQPDGNVVAFGDTSAIQRAALIPGTTAEYAATAGASGPRPGRTFANFKNRGFIFSRSGWFDTQSAAAQSLAAIRFGPSKAVTVHGQQDAGNLSYFALGKQILWQPGVWGGAGGAPRRYVIANESHNTVDVPAAAYDVRATSPLSVTRNSDRFDLVTIRSTALQGVRWQRTMIHFRSPELLLVDDRVTQRVGRTVVQRWHLGRDRTTKVSPGRVGTSGSGSSANFLWVGDLPTLRVKKGQQSPLMGWRSETVNHFTPTPTIEASRAGRNVRLTTLIVPRASGAVSSAIKVLRSSTTGSQRRIDLSTGDRSYRIVFSSADATVTELPR